MYWLSTSGWNRKVTNSKLMVTSYIIKGNTESFEWIGVPSVFIIILSIRIFEMNNNLSALNIVSAILIFNTPNLQGIEPAEVWDPQHVSACWWNSAWGRTTHAYINRSKLSLTIGFLFGVMDHCTQGYRNSKLIMRQIYMVL